MRVASSVRASAVLNGARYDVAEWEVNGPQIEFMRSLYASLPDPRWSVVDSHGHEHRWALTGRDEKHLPEALPTLVRSYEHQPCDGSCGGTCGGEGYTVTVWHCAVCGDPVEPGYIPDVQAQTVGTPVEVGPPVVEFTIAGEPPAEQRRLDVALTVGDQTWTGIGFVTDARWFRGVDGVTRASFTVAADVRPPAYAVG